MEIQWKYILLRRMKIVKDSYADNFKDMAKAEIFREAYLNSPKRAYRAKLISRVEAQFISILFFEAYLLSCF